MKIRISPEVMQKIPGISVGVVVLKNLDNRKKKSVVEQLLRGVCAQKKSQLAKEEKMKDLNARLAKMRASQDVNALVLPEAQLMESGIRKITRGKYIEAKNNLYALTHHLCLKYEVPLYAADLDDVEKDIEIQFITAKKGKRPRDMELSQETRNLVVWFLDIGSQSKEEFEQLAATFADVISKYCYGNRDAMYLLNADNPEADLNYESEKEKLYREEEERKEKERREAETDKTPGDEEEGEEVPFLASAGSPVKPEPLLKERLAEDLLAQINGWLTAQGASGEELLTEVEVSTPGDPSHGDYSTNVALKMKRHMGLSPREIADALAATLKKPDYVEKIEVAGPGFINFRLSQEYLKEELGRVIKMGDNFGRLATGLNETAVIDYSSPNIAKPLGVHHLLSTVFGQAIADMMRFAGYKVISANYLGDWGTQFGKLLYAYKTWGNEEVVKKDPLNELLKLYVRFHNEAEIDPALVDRGREEFKKLEEGDEDNKKLWNWFRDLSMEELDRLYEKLGVKFDEYLPESMYLDSMKTVISEGRERGIITEGEKGALIIRFPEDRLPPYMVQKADGTTLYATRDIASMRDRLERLHATKLIYVVDVAQKLHFEQLFETAGMYGMGGVEKVHVSFGRMQMPEGRMSTRKGDVVLLDEVIKEAVSRTEKIVAEKSQELSLEERAHIALKMAVSSIKYNIISQNPETNIVFDWDRMLSLDGNSGPYLEYAYARARSILRKSEEAPAGKKEEDEKQTTLFSIGDAKKSLSEGPAEPFAHPAEQTLMRLIVRFPEAMEFAVKMYRPNLLCNYLYELARAFSAFYNEVPVLSAGNPELKESRLQIVKGVAMVLFNGLRVLGITTFERM